MIAILQSASTSLTPATPSLSPSTEPVLSDPVSRSVEPPENLKSSDILISTYLARGKQNDPSEVRKLQIFLNTTQGESLTVTGKFDSATRDAVNRYQLKHAGVILHPWGYTKPTGNVLQTTTRQMHKDIGFYEKPLRLPNGKILK